RDQAIGRGPLAEPSAGAPKAQVPSKRKRRVAASLAQRVATELLLLLGLAIHENDVRTDRSVRVGDALHGDRPPAFAGDLLSFPRLRVLSVPENDDGGRSEAGRGQNGVSPRRERGRSRALSGFDH